MKKLLSNKEDDKSARNRTGPPKSTEQIRQEYEYEVNICETFLT